MIRSGEHNLWDAYLMAAPVRAQMHVFFDQYAIWAASFAEAMNRTGIQLRDAMERMDVALRATQDTASAQRALSRMGRDFDRMLPTHRHPR
jgi:hypothetical protein